MRKVFCDGCDVWMADSILSENTVTVSIQREGNSAFFGVFDLCEACERHLLNIVEPSQWVRHKPEPNPRRFE